MNSDVVATIREALESRRRHTAELESINDYFNGAGYTKDEIARIDTALHALDEAAGWEMLPDGEYQFDDVQGIALADNGATLGAVIRRDPRWIDRVDVEMPLHIRLFRKRQPAQEGVNDGDIA